MLHWNLAAANHDTNYHQGETPSYPQPCCSRAAAHNTSSQVFRAMKYIRHSLYSLSKIARCCCFLAGTKRKLVFGLKTGVQSQIWSGSISESGYKKWKFQRCKQEPKRENENTNKQVTAKCSNYQLYIFYL